MIDIEDLTVAIHGTPILRGRLARHRAGEVFGLVGESGSGKSMTALALMGLLPDGATATGTIRLDGDDLLDQPEAAWCATRGNDIAMIFQEPMTALNPVQTIGDQVAETLTIHGQADRGEALKPSPATGSTAWACRISASTPTRTSFPAASGSASASPRPSRSTRGS
jgi:peptide/nickel transport system ATP-binding protein